MPAPFLPERQAARALVAFGEGSERSRADFDADVAALAAAVADCGGGRWLLVTEDSYAAAVSLLALAHAGAVAVLPPNRQPETLRRLAGGARGVLLGGARSDALDGLEVLAPLAPPAASQLPSRLDREAPLAEFHTSGTTREGRAVVKALRHLEDEVRTLEGVLGPALPGDARIFATVPHLHIYGLLFRVLWPLASGRPFQRDTLLHPQEILPRMADCDACALVTTPAHLRRMTMGSGLESVQRVCRAVFSSGGPLDAEVAKTVGAALGAAPWEVLGSTETGGVALRRRDRDGEAWRPLEGVAVEVASEDERLAVTSAFVSSGEPAEGKRQRFVMGDRARLQHDGSFLLLGRADRTVKIGEKRLALPDMESELARHPLVEEVALLVLEQGADPRVHGVVVPSERGRAALASDGRRALGRALAEQLADSWDRVLLPRAWRFVDELPRNAQGKLPRAALEALFAQGREPELLAERRASQRIERRLRVPHDLVHLEGHFEDRPVVAGVVQLQWVFDAARALLGRAPRVHGLEALKFPQPLLPGHEALLEVELSEGGDRLRFQLAEGSRIHASGRCLLEEAGS